MKKLLIAPVLVLTVGLLAACNPLSLLGDVPLDNPLALSGKTIEADLDDEAVADQSFPEEAEVTAAAVNGARVQLETSFNDPKELPGVPDSLDVTIALTTANLIPSATCTVANFPDTMAINLKALIIKISDTAAKSVSKVSNVAFSLNKQVDGSYKVTDLDLTKMKLKLGKVGTVLGNNVNPNAAKVLMRLTVSSNSSFKGCKLKLTIGSAKGSIRF